MEVGTHIGDYEVIRLLGTGGMAEVWLARNPLMRGQYAIKTVLGQYAGSNDIQERFRNEASRQSGLEHPNIVGIRTVLTVNKRVYIVMDYVESGLDKRLHTLGGRSVPIPEAVNITLQLLEALAYTHALVDDQGRPAPLIHRDIKPSNILLQANGTVKLTDFGIALAANEARKTITGQALGTAFYMSPEQITTPGSVDLRTDIYSTGCVLYEMLTGRPPFGKDGDTDFTIQSEHIHKMPEPLHRSNSAIPQDFEWIVMKALAKDRNLRFQSCREMASALLEVYRRAGLPVSQLTSYHGGLTPPPLPPQQAPQPPQPPQAGSHALTQLVPGLQHGGTGNVMYPPSNPPYPPAPGQYPPQTGQFMYPPVPGQQAGPQGYPQQGHPQPGYQQPGQPSGPPQYSQQGYGVVTPPPPPPPPPPYARRKPWYKGPVLYILLCLLLLGVGAGIYYLMPDSVVGGNVILRLEGSTSVGDKLAPALAEAYLTQQLHATNVTTDAKPGKMPDGTSFTTFDIHGDVDGKKQSVQIVSNGSGNAFKALDGGTAELGMSSRPLGASDPASMSYLTSSNQYEHVIALDGIAVVVNPGNHLESLTIAQLRSIFTGAVTDWSQAGGSGGHIHCYGRESTSGTFEMFRNALVGSKGSLSAIQKDDQFSEGKAVVDHVAGDPNGIGYVTFTQAAGVNVVAISDQGTQTLLPNSLTVSTEDYVLTRRLYLYQPAKATKATTDFITFVMSESGQAVVKDQHFVSLMPQIYNSPLTADAPFDYRNDVQGLQRLGLSFRFTSGGGSVQGGNYRLDNLAQDNIARLLAYLEKHPGSHVTLLGFTDNQPGRIPNEVLAKQRADSVANALSRHDVTATTYGLGAEMPVANNGTDPGKAKNRRVEVWVSN